MTKRCPLKTSKSLKIRYKYKSLATTASARFKLITLLIIVGREISQLLVFPIRMVAIAVLTTKMILGEPLWLKSLSNLAKGIK